MMSWVDCLLNDSELFVLFAGNIQILLKISVIPILITLIFLVALNLLVNNQLNSSLQHIIVTFIFLHMKINWKHLSRFSCLYLHNVSFVQYDVVSVNIWVFQRPGLFQMYQIQMLFQINFALKRCFTAIAIEKNCFSRNLLGIWFEFFTGL